MMGRYCSAVSASASARTGEGRAAATHSFAKLLALLGCHLLPALFHAMLPATAVSAAMTMEAAKENLA